MAKYTPATDEQLGKFGRKLIELDRRATKGSIDTEMAIALIQLLIDGNLTDVMYPQDGEEVSKKKGTSLPKRMYYLNHSSWSDAPDEVSDFVYEPLQLRGLCKVHNDEEDLPITEQFYVSVSLKALPPDKGLENLSYRRNVFQIDLEQILDGEARETTTLATGVFDESFLKNTWLSGFSLLSHMSNNMDTSTEVEMISALLHRYCVWGLTLVNMTTLEVRFAGPNGFYLSGRTNIGGVAKLDSNVTESNLVELQQQFNLEWKKATQFLR